MTVGELIVLLQRQDENKRVVVADTDGAGLSEDVEFVDQRTEKGEPLIAIWYHK
jgi:hypothetical protein